MIMMDAFGDSVVPSIYAGSILPYSESMIRIMVWTFIEECTLDAANGSYSDLFPPFALRLPLTDRNNVIDAF
jgi:hypothetical protein